MKLVVVTIAIAICAITSPVLGIEQNTIHNQVQYSKRTTLTETPAFRIGTVQKSGQAIHAKSNGSLNSLDGSSTLERHSKNELSGISQGQNQVRKWAAHAKRQQQQNPKDVGFAETAATVGFGLGGVGMGVVREFTKAGAQLDELMDSANTHPQQKDPVTSKPATTAQEDEGAAALPNSSDSTKPEKDKAPVKELRKRGSFDLGKVISPVLRARSTRSRWGTR